MRIIHVINNAGLNQGGAERLTRSLHAQLLNSAHESVLISLESCDLVGVEKAKSLGFASCRDPRIFFRLFKLLRKIQTDDTVIHAHLFPSILYISILKQFGLINSRAVMTEHNTWNRRRASVVGRFLDRIIYRGFLKIVAISEEAKSALSTIRPETTVRTEVVTNGARLMFDSMPSRKDEEYWRILSVGRLVEQKNYGVALEALSLLRKHAWVYTVAGAGEMEASLKALSTSLGIESRVRFLGHVEDIETLLEESDIFFMPSSWEGFGLSAVEAMNSGLPVVASDVPGLGDLVALTGAKTMPPADPLAFANYMEFLFENPSVRRDLASMGHAVAQQFSEEAMFARYLSFWCSLVSKNR